MFRLHRVQLKVQNKDAKFHIDKISPWCHFEVFNKLYSGHFKAGLKFEKVTWIFRGQLSVILLKLLDKLENGSVFYMFQKNPGT